MDNEVNLTSFVFCVTIDGIKRNDKKKMKQVTQGHNIAAYGWAGASNPHPHPNPPSTFKRTQKVA